MFIAYNFYLYTQYVKINVFVALTPKLRKKSREEQVFGKAYSFVLRLSTFYFSCTYISTLTLNLHAATTVGAHSQQTNIHAPGGIQTHDPSR